MPDRHDFVSEDGILAGIGKLHLGLLYRMKRLSLALLKCAIESKFLKELLLSQLVVTLKNLLHRLQFISTNFRHMQLTVWETQRCFLKLRALLDYYDYFHPTLLLEDSSTATQTYPPTTTKVMGVFTADLMVCDHFFRAGIPVWLVRPFTVVPSVRVRALAPV